MTKSFTAKDAEDAEERKSLNAKDAGVAKENNSLTAKGAEGAKERKSFTAKDAEDAKDRFIKNAKTTPSRASETLRELLIPMMYPHAARGALGLPLRAK